MMSSDGGQGGQDFDLNITPIIDCFTVLIAFMLASAGFLAIGIFDAGISAAGASKSKATPPPIQITIELKKNYGISYSYKGKASRKTTLRAKDNHWNQEALTRELAATKKRFPGVKSVVLKAQNPVLYADLIKMMETTRKHFPSVLLGGF